MGVFEKWCSVALMMLQAGIIVVLFLFVWDPPFKIANEGDASAFELHARNIEKEERTFSAEQQSGMFRNCADTIRIRDLVIRKLIGSFAPIIEVLVVMLVLQAMMFVIGLKRKR